MTPTFWFTPTTEASFANRVRLSKYLHLHRTGSGRLSVQNLSEFFSITTRGAKPKLTTAEATQQVEWLARSWPVLDLTPLIVLEAMRGVRDHRLAFWDSQLWATARLNQIPVIFSEGAEPDINRAT